MALVRRLKACRLEEPGPSSHRCSGRGRGQRRPAASLKLPLETQKSPSGQGIAVVAELKRNGQDVVWMLWETPVPRNIKTARTR